MGPYSIYGEHAFKACAENGTHYLDVTGEVPYVKAMIKKYEKTAKASGAVMIPQIGIDSAPADLVTWTLVNMIRNKFSAPTGEAIVSVHEMTFVPKPSPQPCPFAKKIQSQALRRNPRLSLRPPRQLHPERTRSSPRTVLHLPDPRAHHPLDHTPPYAPPRRTDRPRPGHLNYLPRPSLRYADRTAQLGFTRWTFILRAQFPLQRVHDFAELCYGRADARRDHGWELSACGAVGEELGEAVCVRAWRGTYQGGIQERPF